LGRTCLSRRNDGQACLATPTVTGYCFMHDPERVEARAEARELGGKRRRREGTLAGAYDFDGLDTIAKIRRVLEIAILDALGLDNSVARIRTLISGTLAAAKLLEAGEHEERLVALEAALGPRLAVKKR